MSVNHCQEETSQIARADRANSTSSKDHFRHELLISLLLIEPGEDKRLPSGCSTTHLAMTSLKNLLHPWISGVPA
jgi:hypothetical protein